MFTRTRQWAESFTACGSGEGAIETGERDGLFGPVELEGRCQVEGVESAQRVPFGVSPGRSDNRVGHFDDGVARPVIVKVGNDTA